MNFYISNKITDIIMAGVTNLTINHKFKIFKTEALFLLTYMVFNENLFI